MPSATCCCRAGAIASSTTLTSTSTSPPTEPTGWNALAGSWIKATLIEFEPTTDPVGLPLRTSKRATSAVCQWLCVAWYSKMETACSWTMV